MAFFRYYFDLICIILYLMVNINPEILRSFENYRGDLPGCYIKAMSHSVKFSEEVFLNRIINDAISF
jgi:hypothetical protein